MAPELKIKSSLAMVATALYGRCWAKTMMMAMYLAIVALQHANCTVWYVSQSYSRSLKMMHIMEKCKPFMMLVKPGGVHMQFPPRFEMKNGSEVCFRSADRPDELRGEGLRLICVDEAAILTKYLFWEVLYPMVSDTDGTIIAGSTYNGRNWFYELAEEGKKDLPDKKTWVYPTSSGMRFQGELGMARLARFKANTPPMVWQQECECEPLALIDAVFMYVDQCIGGAPGKLDSTTRYVISQDIGRTYDPSGVVVMDHAGNVAHVEEYPLGMRHDAQARRTLALSQHYNNATVVLDTTGGASGGRSESHVKEYQKIIHSFQPITWTIDTKRNMVNRLALDLETLKVKIPPTFKELIAQLKLYRYKIAQNAIQPSFGPSEGHDDLVAALMMATWAREKHWLSSGNEQVYRGGYA
jgi:hypothetical protein